MELQAVSQYRVNPYAQAQYNRLCEKHGISPTADDVTAIKRVIDPINRRFTGGRFEAALLFFLPKIECPIRTKRFVDRVGPGR